MEIIKPNAEQPETFYVDPKNVDSVWFLFIPVDNTTVIFLMSIIFLKNAGKTIRIEPRYYAEQPFKEFLSNTGLTSLYKILLTFIKNAETPEQIQEQIRTLQNDGILKYEIRTPDSVLNPLELNDYSKCVLFCDEPRTLTSIPDDYIDTLIQKMEQILPPEYTVQE